MKKGTLVYAILVILGGCNASHRATKKLQQAERISPETFAEYVRDRLPCSEIKSDTVRLTVSDTLRDTLQGALRIDTVKAVCPDGTVIKTAYKYNDRYIRFTVREKVYITKTVEDKAVPVIIQKEKDKRLIAETKFSDARKLNWFLFAVIAGCLFVIFLLVKGRKPKITNADANRP